MKNTKKDVGSQLNSLAALTGQIEKRKRYIMAINNDVEAIERELASLQRQLRSLSLIHIFRRLHLGQIPKVVRLPRAVKESLANVLLHRR